MSSTTAQTGGTACADHHAVVVSALTGHGDPELLSRLPGVLPGSRAALVGTHDWTGPTHEPVAAEQVQLGLDRLGLRLPGRSRCSAQAVHR